MRHLSLAVAALVTVASLNPRPALAQQPTLSDPLLDHMIGRWTLTGTIDGQSTTHDVTADWVLGHQYVHLHEVSREKGGNGEPQYQADIYVGWNGDVKQYACVWLDVYGGIAPGSLAQVAPSGDTIAFVFHHDATSSFHNTMVYDRRADSWTWRMDNDNAGQLSPFARVTLVRAGAATR